MSVKNESRFDLAFNMSRVPYKIMHEVLTTDCGMYDGKNLRVYIDLKSILNFITRESFRDEVMTAIEDKDVDGLAYQIINTAAHYHRFFSRLTNGSVETILLYGNKSSYAESLGLEWDVKRKEKMKNLYVADKTIATIERFVDFVIKNRVAMFFYFSKRIRAMYNNDDVKFKCDRFVLPYALEKESFTDEDTLNIFIGQDLLLFQYLLSFNNCLVMTPAGSRAKLITRNSLFKLMRGNLKTCKLEVFNRDIWYTWVAASGGDGALPPLTSLKGVKLLNVLQEYWESKDRKVLGIDDVHYNICQRALNIFDNAAAIPPEDLVLLSGSYKSKSPSVSSLQDIAESNFNNLVNLDFIIKR